MLFLESCWSLNTDSLLIRIVILYEFYRLQNIIHWKKSKQRYWELPILLGPLICISPVLIKKVEEMKFRAIILIPVSWKQVWRIAVSVKYGQSTNGWQTFHKVSNIFIWNHRPFDLRPQQTRKLKKRVYAWFSTVGILLAYSFLLILFGWKKKIHIKQRRKTEKKICAYTKTQIMFDEWTTTQNAVLPIEMSSIVNWGWNSLLWLKWKFT